MPEIAEVSRVCHYLRRHLTNRRIASLTAQEDPKIFHTAKTGLTASSLSKALQGKTVKDAGQQGKYFWLVMDSPPHLLMHFGMTGWIKFSHDETAYYKPMRERKKEEKERANGNANEVDDGGEAEEASEAQDWPPRFWKFLIKTTDNPPVEAAYIDSRRFGRVQLLDVPEAEIRSTSPLKENGPDPVIDADTLTSEWLASRLRSKRVPVKALLLDQFVISGIGNWVADETLYQARIHPEQYSNTLSRSQAQSLHKAMTEVCTTACNLLADSSKFPDHWLMRHRWDKGKKEGNKLPNGDKIVHLTVGGRTSAIVPSVQKKSGAVAGDLDDDGSASEQPPDNKKASKERRAGPESEEEPGKSQEMSKGKGTSAKRKRGSTSTAPQKQARDEKKPKPDTSQQADSNMNRTKRTIEAVNSTTTPRRRSGRISK